MPLPIPFSCTQPAGQSQAHTRDDGNLEPELQLVLEQAIASRQSPIAYRGGALFVYQGSGHERSVELAGELSGWHRRGLRFERTQDRVFYLHVELPEDARLEYKLLVDDDWTLDPWNGQVVINGLGGTNSAFEMPGYAADPWQTRPLPVSPGRVDKLTFLGEAIPGRRQIQVYLPAGYRPQVAYPVVLFQDGGDYFSRSQLPCLLDQLIGRGRIAPVIAVGIDPIHRFQEYTFNEAYERLLCDEILPWLEARYAIRRDAAGRTLAGSSLGGLTAAWLALRHSESFAQVLSQSGSFPFQQELFRRQLEQAPLRPLRFCLTAGRLEGLLQANRNLVRSLARTGYDYQYREHHEGHNWTHWSQRLSQGLIYLLQPDSSLQRKEA